MLARIFASLLVTTGLLPLSHADWSREQIGLTETGPLDCSGVTIAYLDTGADFSSPYLQNALWQNPDPGAEDQHGYDFLHQTGEVVDLDGHGTMVAHMMAASTENPNTMGICSKAQIMFLKVSERGHATVGAIEQALDYAIEKKAQIILMTTGLIMRSGLPPFGIKRRIAKATKGGAVFLHAATNLSALQGVQGPLAHPRAVWPFLIPDRFHPIHNALSIGGSTAEDLPWLGGFRNRDKVHLSAPAEGVSVLNGEGELAVVNGNSLAAGIAAAMAAAYWTAHPEKTSTDVVQALKNSSRKRPAYLVDFASGRLHLPDLMADVVNPVSQPQRAGQAPLTGGTAHPYFTPQKKMWEFSRPGASHVRVVFSYVRLGECWSLGHQAKVTIYNGEGQAVQEFVCENIPRQYYLPSVWVEGDRLTVELETTASQNLHQPGFNFRFLEWSED